MYGCSMAACHPCNDILRIRDSALTRVGLENITLGISENVITVRRCCTRSCRVCSSVINFHVYALRQISRSSVMLIDLLDLIRFSLSVWKF